MLRGIGCTDVGYTNRRTSDRTSWRPSLQWRLALHETKMGAAGSERNGIMTSDANRANGLAIEIRTGVFRPDWSLVTTEAARQALAGRVSGSAGLLEHWSKPIHPHADLVWQTLLRTFAREGRSPRLAEIAAETNFSTEGVTAILRELEKRDLIGLEPGTDTIRFAYPWSTQRTGHRVSFGAHNLWALCAIDAPCYGTHVPDRRVCSFGLRRLWR